MSQPDYLPTECDVILEGGITSGVVFPTFLAGLAKHFTLRNIGGTSVGAVAAAAAAAAQFQRNAARLTPATEGNGTDSFAKLERLPGLLQEPSALGHSNLFSLFQPCRDLAPHFRLLQGLLNRTGFFSVLLALIPRLYVNFPVGTLIGALAPFLYQAYQHGLPAPLAWWMWSALVLQMLASGAVLALAECGWRGLRGLRRNRCGLCPGISEERGGKPGPVPALTEWLHNLVQEYAGLERDNPLSFDALAASDPPIELAFIATGISERRCHRLPSTGEDLLFRVSEMRQLFPQEIVRVLIDKSRALDTASEPSLALLHEADPALGGKERDLYFLPASGDWPIVFAARLSLSFPVLLQAVPLYRLRYVHGDGITKGRFGLVKIWLSDGGLTSNFPIHLFYSLLPNRPTFGISLENTLAEGAPPEERVRLPKNNRQGIAGAFSLIEGPGGLPAVGRFADCLLGTIRTWRDDALKRAPGFRDRIVQIRHTRGEGGLNLNMPETAIKLMSDSGTLAAKLVVERYLALPPQENGWLSHRWVRSRSAASLLQQQMRPLVQNWTDQGLHPSYLEMWTGDAQELPKGYALTAAQRDQGAVFWQELVAACSNSLHADLGQGAPKPRPSLELSPKQT